MKVKVDNHVVELELGEDKSKPPIYYQVTDEPITIIVDQGRFTLTEKNGGLEIVAMYDNGGMFIMETAPMGINPLPREVETSDRISGADEERDGNNRPDREP